MLKTALRRLAFLNRRSRANLAMNAVECLFRIPRPRSRPVYVDVVLTKACNLRCVFCISYESAQSGKWMEFGLYERIARELFPFAATVAFCSGGEPLLYPRLREALALVRDNRAMAVMVSNGMLLDRTMSSWLVRDQSLWDLNISFDGAKRETLQGLRRGADYDLILSNLEGLAAEKHDRKADWPTVRFRYAVMRSNIEELPLIFEPAARVGVREVLVNYLKVTGAMDMRESLYHHPALTAEVFAEARIRARESGVRVKLPPLPRENRSGRRCRSPWEMCLIDPDGSIRHCYYSWLQRLGWFDDGFERVWRGDSYAGIRQTLDSPEPYYPYCRHCPVRRGWGLEDSHNQNRPEEDYLILGLEHLQTSFNRRSSENRGAFQERRPGASKL